MFAQVEAWNWASQGPLMTIIGALMIGIGFMFKTWVSTTKEHSQVIKETTDVYRSDIKELTDKQVVAQKEVAEKFISLHRETLDRLTQDKRT